MSSDSNNDTNEVVDFAERLRYVLKINKLRIAMQL
jgi:hypothetical protein